MTWLVNTRVHPVDMVFTRICGLRPIYMLALQTAGSAGSSVLPVLVTLVTTAWAFFIHADLR